MICDHQSKKLPSCVARQMAMIYFEKSNIPNASETNRCICNGGHFIESFDYKGLQPPVPSFVSVRQRWFLVVKRPQFGSVLRGTTLRDSQLCLRF